MIRSSDSVLPEDAQATVTWAAGRSLVVVEGEFDAMFAESGADITTLLTDQRLPAAIDLSRVTLFCAAGVRWLTSMYVSLDTDVEVVAASVPVRRSLGICGVPMHSAGRPSPAPPWSPSLN